jgi:hypothetical protein
VKLPYIIADDSIIVHLAGKSVPIGKATPTYEKVLQAIKDDDHDRLLLLLQPRKVIALMSVGEVQLVDGDILYKGESIHPALVTRILAQYKEGIPVTAALRFIDKAYQNPNPEAIAELYEFLTACLLPICEDGDFLAYKYITHDYKDCYTKTLDYSIGAKPSMPREACDADRTNLCSRGLHFCSFKYLGGGGGGDRLVVVKINPANVTSIPKEYNLAKGRCCAYEILEEIEWGTRIESDDPFADKPHEDDEEEEESSNVCQHCGADDGSCSCDTGGATLPNAKAKGDTSRKLDAAGVKKFRKLLDKDGVTLTAACAMVGISRRQGARIRDGENWAEL